MDKFEELDGRVVNPSKEPTIGEVISRRTMLKGMAAAGGTFGLFGCAGSSMLSGNSAAPSFAEVPRSTGEGIQVPPGYTAQVLLRQGDPIKPGAPEYNPATQTGAEQEQQFGSDPDFISFMPLPYGSNSSTRGLLGVNHEIWRDEMRALTIAREADSALDLPRALENEGHPVLWYLVLRVAYAIAPATVVMKVVATAIGVAAAALLLFRAPLPTWWRVLFVFGWVPLYGCSVLCRNYGLGVIPYSPLAGGFLTGKYRRGVNVESVRASDIGKKYGNEQGFAVIEKLDAIGKSHGRTVAQTALAWLLTNPLITAPIIGANTPAQLQDALGAAGYRLSADEMKALNDLTKYPMNWRDIWD